MPRVAVHVEQLEEGHRKGTSPTHRTGFGRPTSSNKTGEGKLYICAIKDVISNRIMGYSISDRMRSLLAVDALANVARRGEGAGCILHTGRGSQFPVPEVRPCVPYTSSRHPRVDGQGRRGWRQRRDGVILRAAAEESPRPPQVDHPPRAADHDRDLD